MRQPHAVKCHGVAIPKCAEDYPQSPEGTALYNTGCKSCENNAETFLERIFQKTNITFFTAHPNGTNQSKMIIGWLKSKIYTNTKRIVCS